ncbi:hypothetical protein F441_18939 [Phytophthora nicotianae CJ01A1]|uniref:Secreted protein n=6 Tax=Phytophthora nicotianae TaxID=4792 RepID=W2QWY2_PHYN3|nr:hypothetical protein PPTG_21648 [Phytophthora nicotianae INRA-310]ETI34339.1 hypothetical protein F443_19128 [Phytophthora nicotianae P1569]ETK74699.1 hypothetical protein L915_18552 [Phytophthora nicotianae]ETO63155.1 hypothetical protein F444_19084 [Phytophthora nicotianae P1976]ETP04243.1 hypothetical protein F441_18939 [Phytophthora nicotianae CJ01A1]ETP32391.1 hypothetical protein F442_18902 [Phytophthora nicotianae P10297]
MRLCIAVSTALVASRFVRSLPNILESTCQRERRTFMHHADCIWGRQWTHLVVRSDHIGQEIDELVSATVRRLHLADRPVMQTHLAFHATGLHCYVNTSPRQYLLQMTQHLVRELDLLLVVAVESFNTGMSRVTARIKPQFFLLDFNRCIDLRVEFLQECGVP